MKETGRIRELMLLNKNLMRIRGYSAAFLLLNNLNDFIDSDPHLIGDETVSCLAGALENRSFETRKTSVLFYREVAGALVRVAVTNPSTHVVKRAVSALKNSLKTAAHTRHRGISEAMGAFPVQIETAHAPRQTPVPIPETDLNNLIRESGIPRSGEQITAGRSLICSSTDDRVLVIKFLKSTDAPESVAGECLWMDHLNSKSFEFQRKFHIPTPVAVSGSFIFRVSPLPNEITATRHHLHTERYAIAYVASKEYFIYPNETSETPVSEEDVADMLSRNAFLMGSLLAKGIVHTAPIPLFHNRVQQDRRDDEGLYLWPRGGRLDRWLESCRYPNFGKSGLRDFEHLEPYRKRGRNLYETIGTHLLSLILVAGSCFRTTLCNTGQPKTCTEEGKTVTDTRHLFDKELFLRFVSETLNSYHAGFTGCRVIACKTEPRQNQYVTVPYIHNKKQTGDKSLVLRQIKWCARVSCDHTALQPDPLIPLDFLIERMIEEMGVDRYMEEVLRATDQHEMSMNEFHNFLNERAYPIPPSELSKGEKDITLLTGPHLGGFNRKISLPELIGFLETASALCITDKYVKAKG